MSSASSVKDFTRGGQTLLHNFRMINQVMNRVFIFSFMFFIILTGAIIYFYLSDYQLYLFWQWIIAKALFFLDKNSKQSFINPQ